MQRGSLFLILFVFSLLSTAQVTIPLKRDKKPKLVVGIVIDQMRYDYITRFWNKYNDDGFKRLITQGFNFKNNHFNYVPTYTGPGHASIFTGTVPSNHGIIGNNWYDKFSDQEVYCTQDDLVLPIGTQSAAGKMSPHRMKTTTVADENRLHTQMKGKTIGIALKDRGSILPAGHTANAAYWFHGENEGKWITSSFYLNELPTWVKEFNESGIVDSYLKPWTTLFNLETYVESGADLNAFETGFIGMESAVFPYDLKSLAPTNNGYDLLKTVAYGNDLTLDFALAALKAEELGKDEFTDFLTLSFSSTDYVAHNFGVNSKEIQDTYLRLDQNLAKLLNELDQFVGEGNYTIFLTADHGGVNVPSYLQSLKIPSGYFDHITFEGQIKKFVADKFKANGLIRNISNNQIFLNYEALQEKNINKEEIEKVLAHFLLQLDQIDKVFTRTQISENSYLEGMEGNIKNGFNQKRSGDIIFILDPATIIYPHTGSTHGSGLMYDTHAPLIFFGAGIGKGSTTQRSEITDIAPTISALLGISFPNSSIGKPLNVMLDQ